MAQRAMTTLGAMTATVGLQLLVIGLVSQSQNWLLVLSGSALAVVLPWPAGLLSLRCGNLAATAVVLFAGILLRVLGSWEVSLAYLVQFGVGSVVVPALLKRRWRWDGAVAVGAGLSAAGGVAALAIYAARLGQGPLQLADSWARAEVDRALASLKTAELSPEAARQTKELLSAVGDRLVEWYPAISVLTIAVILLMLVLFLCRRGVHLLPTQPRFRDWRLPDHLIWALIFSGSGTLFLQGAWQRLAWNLAIVTLAVYFLQGLAILSYFFNLKGVPPIVRALGYFLVVVSFPLRILATGVGVFDLWVDFRKPRNRKD